MIKKPVFVIGTGRSGLTPLMDMVSYHSEFGWISQHVDKHPRRSELSFISRIVEYPFFNKIKYMTQFNALLKVPFHAEAWKFWNYLYTDFVDPFRDLDEMDVSPDIKKRFHRAIGEILRYQGKRRFITEYSDWSRIGFFKKIFPDSKFIHIIRDGRAVANSLLNVHWWKGRQGIYKWKIGKPPSLYLNLIEKYDNSFVAMAGVYWKFFVNQIDKKAQSLNENDYFLVKYEDLCKDPLGWSKKCLEFCEVDQEDSQFNKNFSILETTDSMIADANNKSFRIKPWREYFSSKEIEMLDDILHDELKIFNYK